MFGATGIPRSRSTALNRSLSMQSADAVTPEPMYGTPASSSKPCTVPSSPNGPCRIGSTTSTAPSAAGVAAVGTGRSRARLGERERDIAGRQRPGAVASDLDHPRLVAGGIERLDDRARRGERDLVLARAATGEHGHADAAASRRRSGSSSSSCRSVSVVVVSTGGATYFPTNSVTTVFGSCWLLPTGSWEITTPSNVSTSVSCGVTSTLNPAAFRVAVASCLRLARSRPAAASSAARSRPRG